MQVIKVRRTKINNLKIFNSISLCFTFIAFITFFGLYFIHYGYDLGYELAEKIHSIQSEEVMFSIHGLRVYEGIANIYKYIAELLIVFLIIKTLEKKFDKFLKISIFLQTTCFYLLSLVLYQLWWLFAQKELRSQSMFWDKPYDRLLRSSVQFDWFCLFIILTLVIIQFITTAQYYFCWKNQK